MKSKKATARAPANIAFIKYWGKKDTALNIPENDSISVNLSYLHTTTTVEFRPELTQDMVTIDQQLATDKRIVSHLDRVRKLANKRQYARVVSESNFPSSTGLSSSASGYAALSVAAASALGLSLSEKRLSTLARLGSGSAARSIPDGFVYWHGGSSHDSSYAESMYPPEYWNLIDVVVILTTEKKPVSTTAGHTLVGTSPFYRQRLKLIPQKIKRIKQLLAQKDFKQFGELVEAEAIELHAIMLTSNPSLMYWQPETMRLLHAVRTLRRQGIAVYFTLNTGQNVHLFCQARDVDTVTTGIAGSHVHRVIVNTPAKGTQLISEHLF